VELIDPKKRVKNRVGQMFFSKVRNVLTFLYILLKRTLHSLTFFAKERLVLYVLLRSLQENVAFSTFFAKECNVLCVLLCYLEKNVKERNILLGFISRQKCQKKVFLVSKVVKKLAKNSKKNVNERGAQPWSKIS